MQEEDTEEYICLINEEEQYSLWFAWKEIPLGWKQVGPKGPKAEVLAYVKEVWTDMRPKSLREQMDRASKSEAGLQEVGSDKSSSDTPLIFDKRDADMLKDTV